MAKIHTQFQDELSAYLDDELAPDARQRIEAHLHTCDSCVDTIATLRENQERVKRFAHLAPPSLEGAVMAKIRQQAAEAHSKVSTPRKWILDIRRWVPDLGRWFMRPVTAGATGMLTLILILGALYFYPTGSQYEETLDFYFGLHTEQLIDNTLESDIGDSFLHTTSSEDSLSTETADDTELFLDLYLEDVGD